MFRKFYLTYNPKIIQDGYCAQLQRQIGLIAVAKRFKMSFLLTNIESITITPMDGNRSESEARSFIDLLNNKFFKNYSENNVDFQKIIDIPTPTLKQFFRIWIKNLPFKGKILKKVLESLEFKKVLESCSWSNYQIDWRLFTYFKKDFWKEFM